MPFLQSSGPISILNLHNFFPNPAAGLTMSNFYRGGGRVPATKTVREPASGELYQFHVTFWYTASDNYRLFLKWGNTWVLWDVAGAGNATSYSVGGYTYFRGNLNYDNTGYGGDGTRGYGIWRTSIASINGSIPSSGQISLSQFYGAETP